MSDDDNMPQWEAADWESLLSRPEVDHVEIVENVIRVRLTSGVELEWALTGLEGLS